MTFLEELHQLGIDIDSGVQRLLNKEELYIKMLCRFPDVVRDCSLAQFLKKGEIVTAQQNAHTLKGVAGNLSIIPLYEAYSKIDYKLRDGDIDGAREIYNNIFPTETNILTCITRHKNI